MVEQVPWSDGRQRTTLTNRWFLAEWGRLSGGEFVYGQGAISRRDAEAQRVLICVVFSPRLCVSAGESFRCCVVELLLHRGTGGRSEEDEWVEFVFEYGLSFPLRR